MSTPAEELRAAAKLLREKALMGPHTTPGVAALLEHYAECVAWSDNWDDVHNCGKPMKQFARSVLASATPEES